MSDNWGIMYDVQRCYRNAALGHVARALAAQYGVGWFENQVKPLFSDGEWKKLEQQVPDRYAGLNIAVPRPFEWLGVAHLTTIVQKHGRYLVDGARTLQPQPRQRRIDHVATQSRRVRDIRDPVAHPPTEDLPLRDLLYFTRLSQLVLDDLGLQADAMELAAILDNAGSPPSTQVEASIPPPSMIVRDFVGRENELQALTEWFSSDDEPIRVIAGGGGTGKSALAYQVAVEQIRLPVTRLNFILWMTAKQRMLSRGKIVSIEADIYDDGDTLQQLWLFFGGDGDPDLATLLQILNDTPGLIIADDVDSLSGEGGERARALLTREIPYRSRTKVLATSRRQLFGLENMTTTLTGFSQADTGTFVRSRLHEQSVPVEFTSSQIAKIKSVTDGVPLYIDDLLRFIQTLDFESALRQWKDTGGEDPRAYALKREFEGMSEEAKKVLLTASRMGRPVSAYDMSTVLRIGDDAILSAVNELRNLFFMSLPSFVEGVPRFTVGATTARLVDDVMRDTYEYDRICKAVDYYEQQASVTGYERGRIGEVHRTVRHLINRGELEDAEQVLDRALVELPSNPDLIGSRGYLFKHWSPPRLVDARGAFAAAADLHSKNPSVYWEWADLNMTQKDYGAAAEAAERGLDECDTHPQLLRIAGAARRDLGNRLVKNIEYGRAIEEYRKARVHFKQLLDANNKADTRYRISVRDFYFLNITLLDLMDHVDTSEDYAAEIRRLATAWKKADRESGEPDRWLVDPSPKG